MRASDKTHLWVRLSVIKDIELRRHALDDIVLLIESLLEEERSRKKVK